MKKLFVILIFFSAIWVGCDSNPIAGGGQDVEGDQAQAVQDWFELQAEISVAFPSSAVAEKAGDKQKLEPDWDRGIRLSLTGGNELLIFPIKDFSVPRVSRRFVAEEKDGKIKKAYYLDFYGPSARIDDLSGLVHDWHLNQRITSGFHIAAEYSLKMKFVGGGVYKDGALVAEGGVQKRKKQAAPAPGKQAEECSMVEDCTTYYFILVYPDGIEVIADLGEYCVPPCDEYDEGSGGSGSGGGSSGGSGSQIYFTLLDECLVDLLWSSSLTPGGVVASMVGTFANGASTSNWNWFPTSHPDFALFANADIDPTAAGFTARSLNMNPVSYFGASGYQSYFNRAVLTQGTDLAAMRTLFHEATHAFLTSLANGNTVPPDAPYEDLLAAATGLTTLTDQHNWMTQHYITPMAQILQAYGDSKGYLSGYTPEQRLQWYSDLAWGGLSGTALFQSMSPEERNRIADSANPELDSDSEDAVGTALGNCLSGS